MTIIVLNELTADAKSSETPTADPEPWMKRSFSYVLVQHPRQSDSLRETLVPL